MNIGNGTIINTRLRINMIMADSITTEINMNMRISSMNVSSIMHIDIHTIIRLVSVMLVPSMNRSTNRLLCICNVANASIRIAIKLL